MKRRLNLASALVHRPEVLFLDEPTEGLDPQSRTALWEELERVNRAGTTMFLTTHYMEEADRLCGRLGIIDHGRIVASGSPDDLKRAVGSDTVMLRLEAEGGERLAQAQAAVERLVDDFQPVLGTDRTPTGVASPLPMPRRLPRAASQARRGRLVISGLSMDKPSLDDSFLHFTGRRIRAKRPINPSIRAGTGAERQMAMIANFTWETRWLGLRTLRRFYRVPANPLSIVLFPLIQLFVFSQMFKDIVQLPGFGGETSYLQYLAPGQIVFTVFFATAWSGGNLLFDYRNGMLDKLRVTPINRFSILAGELVPLFMECMVMGGLILALSVLLGASIRPVSRAQR